MSRMNCIWRADYQQKHERSQVLKCNCRSQAKENPSGCRKPNSEVRKKSEGGRPKGSDWRRGPTFRFRNSDFEIVSFVAPAATPVDETKKPLPVFRKGLERSNLNQNI